MMQGCFLWCCWTKGIERLEAYTWLLFISDAFKFKISFLYKERGPHYDNAPSNEDWDLNEKVCQFFEAVNLATLVILGSEYPSSNLYFAEV